MTRAPFRIPAALLTQIQAGLQAAGCTPLETARLAQICEDWWNWQAAAGPTMAYVYGVLDTVEAPLGRKFSPDSDTAADPR